LSSTVCRFLGRVSYPLYAIHQPLLYASLHPLARILGAPLAAVTVFIPCCAVAYIIAQFVDEPLNAITKHHVTATIAPEGAAVVPSSMPIS
jgi:peptidoglycan/LPS O-acetylase OafA/YrhL